MLRFHVITLFPDVCKAYTDASILGRAQKTEKGMGAKHRGKKISVTYYNPREFTTDAHQKVDDRPYGGGPGMVMKAEPILRAWVHAVGRVGKKLRAGQNKRKIKTLILSPRGRKFDQTWAEQLGRRYTDIVLISGRYEGIDARVKKILRAEGVSVGDYVLTGGELPALTIIDAISRTVPGVLGTYESLETRRVAAGDTYTRPDAVRFGAKTYRVPAVLREGNHAAIEEWRTRAVAGK